MGVAYHYLVIAMIRPFDVRHEEGLIMERIKGVWPGRTIRPPLSIATSITARLRLRTTTVCLCVYIISLVPPARVLTLSASSPCQPRPGNRGRPEKGKMDTASAASFILIAIVVADDDAAVMCTRY